MQVKSKRGPSANLSELSPGSIFKLQGQYLMKTKSRGGASTTQQMSAFTCVDLRSGELEHIFDSIVELTPGHFQLT